MPTVRRLPPSQVLDWHEEPSSLPGGVRHVTRVSAPELVAMSTLPVLVDPSVTTMPLPPPQGVDTEPMVSAWAFLTVN